MSRLLRKLTLLLLAAVAWEVIVAQAGWVGMW